ncbi:MAG: TaqI-like C-terminal specificity domain-containing protein, partial [Melioribacteraceae bacterium]
DEAKPLYTRFVKFFNHLNVGHTYEEYSLPAYNGGLFQEDEILDNVKIDDEILLTDIIKLSSYDFSSEVDVNILGHIFEHSLSEIEELTAELEGNLVEREKSKRKKDGIFYTPKYITKYIVDNTIGSLCTEKKKELKLDEIDDTILESSRTQKGKLNQKAKTLFDNLDKYREYILSLKILDPACGSGAFLNQALEFLIKEHKWIDEHKSSLLKEAFTISEYKKEIVENNIYGVDINEEAVEIAKLSLWLRTAKKGRKLSTLSNNIKCGNSLIDDPKVAGNKAFNWNEEFKEIMNNGGFDVVIGNPPYLNMTRNNIDKGWLHYFIKNYVSIKKSNSKNIFTLFIEKGIQLLRNNKNLSFIIPEGFLKTRSYNECLDYTKLNGSIISSVYFDSFVFKDAVTGSLIINFKKGIFNSENSIINYLNGQFIEYLNEKDKVLEKVLSNNFKTLSEIGKLFKGMVVKDRDSVLYKNFISSAKTNDKFLLGSNINRYRINSFWYCNYKELEIIGGTKLKTKYDIYPRILIRRTGDSLCSVLLKEKALTESTLYSFYIEKNEYDYFFVLGILNSKIATYIIRKEMITNKQAFPQILMTDLEKFVIPNVNQFIKTKIENLVKKILEYQNKLSSLFSNYFSRIESNLTINKFTNAIKEFNKYDFKTFVIELKKQKIELTLKKQDEWEEYFNEYKTKINQLQEEITKTDNEIDVMVYKLYNLTYEEVKIVDPQFWMREEVYNQFEISKTELK